MKHKLIAWEGCLQQTSSSVRARQRVRAYGCIPEAAPETVVRGADGERRARAIAASICLL